ESCRRARVPGRALSPDRRPGAGGGPARQARRALRPDLSRISAARRLDRREEAVGASRLPPPPRPPLLGWRWPKAPPLPLAGEGRVRALLGGCDYLRLHP